MSFFPVTFIHNDNEFISAYPFYMKLTPRPKIIYTKKEILYNEIP